MTAAIITTSINAQPETYEEYARQGDLYVAGDTSSPPELEKWCHEVGAVYLSYNEQAERWPLLSAIVGPRSIQRRNFALLAALEAERNYDAFITIDDDNIPTETFVADHVHNLGEHDRFCVELTSSRDWVNIGDVSAPAVWQRGTPYGYAIGGKLHHHVGPFKVGVSQSIILGDPDIDAVTRIAEAPAVRGYVGNVIVDPAKHMFAFNSQATAWLPGLAPLMAVLPGVGRYDDIFASFIANHIMGTLGMVVHVGAPTVTQERNEHNLAKDLAGELFGMRTTYDVVTAIQNAAGLHSAREHYDIIIDNLRDILPDNTIEFMTEWHRLWVERSTS